ncbi:MAG: prepilin-type N-terminal cleavage/methylation domain-containing protein [Candidatus Muiribacteriota bacterium]
MILLKNKGFSLVELMVSTVLLMMLALLVNPNPMTKVRVRQEAQLKDIIDSTRRALIQYRNDYGFYPKIRETYNYIDDMNVSLRGVSLEDDVFYDEDYNELNGWEYIGVLRMVLEASLLEAQLPYEFRYIFMPEDMAFQPPYLRGDGKSSPEIIWHEHTQPRGFFENPVTYDKDDWEVLVRDFETGHRVWVNIGKTLYDNIYYDDPSDSNVISGINTIEDLIDPPSPLNDFQITDIRFPKKIGESRDDSETGRFRGINKVYYYEW